MNKRHERVAAVDIDLAKKGFSYQDCPRCNGAGKCPACGGSGEAIPQKGGGPCSECYGEGTCPNCGGSGDYDGFTGSKTAQAFPYDPDDTEDPDAERRCAYCEEPLERGESVVYLNESIGAGESVTVLAHEECHWEAQRDYYSLDPYESKTAASSYVSKIPQGFPYDPDDTDAERRCVYCEEPLKTGQLVVSVYVPTGAGKFVTGLAHEECHWKAVVLTLRLNPYQSKTAAEIAACPYCGGELEPDPDVPSYSSPKADAFVCKNCKREVLIKRTTSTKATETKGGKEAVSTACPVCGKMTPALDKHLALAKDRAHQKYRNENKKAANRADCPYCKAEEPKIAASVVDEEANFLALYKGNWGHQIVGDWVVCPSCGERVYAYEDAVVGHILESPSCRQDLKTSKTVTPEQTEPHDFLPHPQNSNMCAFCEGQRDWWVHRKETAELEKEAADYLTREVVWVLVPKRALVRLDPPSWIRYGPFTTYNVAEEEAQKIAQWAGKPIGSVVTIKAEVWDRKASKTATDYEAKCENCGGKLRGDDGSFEYDSGGSTKAHYSWRHVGEPSCDDPVPAGHAEVVRD